MGRASGQTPAGHTLTHLSSLTLDHLGCRLHGALEGSGPPVVFIQGVGVHGEGWRPQVEGLASEFQCLTFDNRGMGRSQPSGGRISVAQMVDDAVRLMDHVGWASAHLVGHSLGGTVALALALAHPLRVRSLSLLCTFARGRDATSLSPRMLWRGLRTVVGTRAMRRRAFLRIVMPGDVLAETDVDRMAEALAPLFGHDLAESPPVAMKQLAALHACDVRARLGELAGLPTLVMGGAQDPISRPASGRAIAAGIPGARYVEFADASHGLPIHLPGEVNGLLSAHLHAAESARHGAGSG